jgi:hypothetical protein
VRLALIGIFVTFSDVVHLCRGVVLQLAKNTISALAIREQCILNERMVSGQTHNDLQAESLAEN